MAQDQQLSDLWEEDLREWLALPVSRLLLEHLRREKYAALDAIADDLREGRDRPAIAASGGVAVIETLWSVLHPGPRPVEAQEQPFVDPAER